MSTEFAAPASASGIDWNELNGHLVVIEVQAHETGIVTANGERDAIRATVHDVDGQQTDEDVLIFPKVLVSNLRPRIGQKVLGRVGQGVAKPGQNAPWVLTDASAYTAAAAAATAYLAAHAAGQFSAPAAAAQAQAPVPAASTAAQPAAATPALDVNDPNVQAALAALAAQQKAPF